MEVTICGIQSLSASLSVGTIFYHFVACIDGLQKESPQLQALSASALPTRSSSVGAKEADGESVEFWALNDTAQTVTAQAEGRVMTFGGETIADDGFPVTLPPGSATLIATHALDEFGTDEERKGRFVTLSLGERASRPFTMCSQPLGERASRPFKVLHRNEWFFAPFKDCPVENAKIDATVGRADPCAPQITLTTDKPAFFVWVNATGVRGEFDDNSFTLLPDEPRTLTFTPKGPIDADAFRRSLSVTDLSKSFDAATQSTAGQRRTKGGREP